MGDLSYECCECDEDVTDRVREAFDEQLYTVRLEMASTEAERDSVIVACSRGHLCRYYGS